ncbi:hypothetical protein [Dolosigranulum savutiense]|uniref:Nudix hydrolase domain-containing protein n=1 Tax=Dolosigranulum savutiense TaxID=3110288 RepID=A0AB74TFY9_9LACT
MHLIAGTIMKKGLDNRMAFLMQEFAGEKEFFPATEIIENCTALASVIEEIKEITGISADQMELVELTNTVYKSSRIPLYVFEYVGDDKELQVDKPFKWGDFKELKETFEDYEIEGVPLLSELTIEVI